MNWKLWSFHRFAISIVLIRLGGMSPTTGVQLFRRDIKGRQGGGVTLYIRKRLDCAAIAVMDDVVESLWLRIKGTDSKAHVVSVYY